MTATSEQAESGSNATRVTLREAVFDALCESQGAITETEKADLVGCDRGTLYRIRAGKINPRASLVMDWAARLGVTVEALWAKDSPPPHRPDRHASPPSRPPHAPKPPAGPHTPKPPAGPKTHEMEAAA